MIRLVPMLLAFSAAPGLAETARVTSGEHSEFTRLVIELPESAGWTVGRTAMGYGFLTKGETQPGYDLSSVWDRIPRTRLQALRSDPGSGALLLTLACDCHVLPFEYQPGTVVLDLRNGPAPPGSVFEAALATVDTPAQRSQPPFARDSAEYDWLADNRPDMAGTSGQDPGLALPERGVSLAPLREELMQQLSRGAADGVVDMVLPGKPRVPEVEGMGDLSGALIRIGELPGLEVGSAATIDAAEGAACIDEAVIDLGSWGDGRPPLDLLAEARAGLYGEFDTLSTEALRQAVKLHLYLGFGAEAAQYGSLLPDAGSDPDLAPLLSMARLIDGETDPASPFATMLGCDGPAALWAALSHASLPAGTDIDTKAIVRSFQMLPSPLRQHLGPRLAELLRERDADATRMIRDAIARTPDIPAGTIALLDAVSELAASRPETALALAEAAVEADASDLAGLGALVEAHLQSGTPLSPEVAESLMALREVSQEDVAQRDQALILALALSGQVDEAFTLAGSANREVADLWQALALQADDDAFLSHAILAPSGKAPEVDPVVGQTIAARLQRLGFPEAALIWLGPVDDVALPERRLIAADAQLALGNARSALQLLWDISTPAAEELKIAAYQQIGAYDAARQALVKAGKVEDSLRLASWDRDWDALQVEGKPRWAEAAGLAVPVRTEGQGPLAEGQAALDDSAAARSAIEALLADVEQPAF